MWEEDGPKIAHHLSIKIERKKYVQKIVYKKTKKIVCKQKKLYVKRKKCM